jgi:hypothetical protein
MLGEDSVRSAELEKLKVKARECVQSLCGEVLGARVES